MSMKIILSSALVAGLMALSTSAAVHTSERLSARQAAPSYSYLGCYTEGNGVRALGSFSHANSNMTVEYCASLCASTYKLFGLEYSSECWCANVLGSGSSVAPAAADCSMTCAGNVSETCGGGNRLSVYSTAGGTAPPSAPVHVASAPPFTRLGCYTEGNNTRALSGFQQYDYSGMTVEKCAAVCAATPYTLMGVEYGGECYCGLQPQFTKSGSVAVPDTECSILCAGNSTEYCGAGNRLDIYRIPPAAEA